MIMCNVSYSLFLKFLSLYLIYEFGVDYLGEEFEAKVLELGFGSERKGL